MASADGHDMRAKPLLAPDAGVGVSESVAGGRCRQQQHSERLHIILQLPRTKPAGPGLAVRPIRRIREIVLLPAIHGDRLGHGRVESLRCYT